MDHRGLPLEKEGRTMLRTFTLILTALMVVFALPVAPAQTTATQWQSLFNGENLDGWIRRGGTADYRVEEGAIVGTTAPNTPNTFLCTERDYGDFILELECRVDPALNSGIQIRSLSDPNYQRGRVHGYQIESDPSDRAWSGGIYDESRRGWLVNLEDNEAGRRAFRRDDWNHYRIVAVGDTIKVWVNGIPTAHLIDTMTPTGFIALQVHATDSREPLEVRWRNIRILPLDMPGLAATRTSSGNGAALPPTG